MKVGVHSYLPNAQINLRSNFNYENATKIHVHACLSNGNPNLWSSFNSEKLVKSETPSCSFVRVWIKGAEDSSEHRESWRALLSIKSTSKSWSNFNSKKLVRSETLSCIFTRVGLKGSPNSSEHCKSWHARLFIKWASKSMINSILRISSKVNSMCGFAKVWLKRGQKRLWTSQNLACTLIYQMGI